MLFPESTPRQVKIPASLLQQPAAEEPSLTRSLRKRDLTRRMSGIVALRHGGCVVAPVFTDARGSVIQDESTMIALRSEATSAIRELAGGRAAHARRTLAALLDASGKSDADRVLELLAALYANREHRTPDADALSIFFDTFEGWLTAKGVAKVDLVFDSVDLDRVPPTLGVLLLAMTRLTRDSFHRRAPFIERLRTWLIGRDGRTAQDVDNMLGGLRE